MGKQVQIWALAWLLGAPTLARAALPPNAIELAWDVSPSPGVAGYLLYSGTESGHYSSALQLGTQTTAILNGLQQGKTYFFAVTCYDLGGLESDFSAEISYTVPVLTRALLSIAAEPGANVTLNCIGPPRSSYDILVSTNLVNWSVLGNAALDFSGFYQYREPISSDVQSRYFRLRENLSVRQPSSKPSVPSF